MFLTKLIVLAFAGMARVGFVIAEQQSPPPPPAPSEARQEKQEARGIEDSHAQPSNTPPGIIPAMIDQPKSQPSEQANQAHSNQDREESSFNRWNALAVTVFTAALAVLALLQWMSMRQQAGYMRDGLGLTRQGTDAATESAKAATKAANEAEKSVTFARENAHLDQRAWLAAFNIRGVPKANELYQISIIVKNTGKTFAKNFWINPVVTPRKKGVIPDFMAMVEKEATNPGQGEFISKTFMPPEGTTTATITVSPKLGQGDIDAFKSGEMVIWVFGKISYDDIFKCPHWTTFCSVLTLTERGDWEYMTYSTFNETDENDDGVAKTAATRAP